MSRRMFMSPGIIAFLVHTRKSYRAVKPVKQHAISVIANSSNKHRTKVAEPEDAFCNSGLIQMIIAQLNEHKFNNVALTA